MVSNAFDMSMAIAIVHFGVFWLKPVYCMQRCGGRVLGSEAVLVSQQGYVGRD